MLYFLFLASLIILTFALRLNSAHVIPLEIADTNMAIFGKEDYVLFVGQEFKHKISDSEIEILDGQLIQNMRLLCNHHGFGYDVNQATNAVRFADFTKYGTV